MRRDERMIGCGVALSGVLMVVLGAYAAHGLAERASAAMVSVMETGVRYQAWHTLAVLGVLVAQRIFNLPGWRWVAGLWALGVVGFSGSLYLMALAGLRVGIITPMGGVLLMAGWLALAVSVIRAPRG
ncbi:DUF423 domain-containing protein [Halomonas aquamarina]|uniref:DUF423 domain-containing protein n=1 Tax=Vreelandella aquamarina TaxID=77097 RepID=A0ACC5VUF8_9GAMM|nr:DUF423 domain-containing protein [Halomonas aquamarina]MBZ5487600.1 DUF423 domain-containing protein [Halomonas aquamarina]